MYVATINIPGYLPMDDDPPVFDTTREAWEYLAGERNQAEDYAFDAGADASEGFSATHNTMEAIGTGHMDPNDAGLDHDGVGTIYGPTPGYEGEHDLGLAYTVSILEEEGA